MKPILAILLSACCISCSHQDPVKPAATPTAASTASSPAATPVAESDVASPEPGETSVAEFQGITGVTEKKRPQMAVTTLTGVRTGKHENFDRIVFDFAGSVLPGYRIEYVNKPVRSCGSGDAITVAGDGLLHIQLMPAQAHTDAGEATVKERARVLNLPLLKELKLICDFEADVQWALGVSTKNRYRVLELSSPARLVVDIRHSSQKSEVSK